MNTQHPYAKKKKRLIEKFSIFPPTGLQEESKMAEHNHAHGTFLQTLSINHQQTHPTPTLVATAIQFATPTFSLNHQG